MLTSPRNPRIAAATRLKKRAFREADGRFLVEGAQAVSEALDEPAGLEMLFATDDLDPLVVRARQAGVEVQLVNDNVMGRLTSTVTPQGLVGVAPFVDVELEALARHRVRGRAPRGTRPRERRDRAALGRRRRRRGLVFSETSVDVYNPKTVRASAGSLFHLPVVRERLGLGGRRRAACPRLPGSRDVRGRRAGTCTAPTSPGPSPSCSATRPAACPRRWPRSPMPVCASHTRVAPSR